jgi:hypothetical protein
LPFPEGFLPALEALGQACEHYRKMTGMEAVLVGGAATSIYTSGHFLSGDFDLVASDYAAFDAAMQQTGFRSEDRAGYLRVGYYHPVHPTYGFQQVSGSLFDGRADRTMMLRIQLSDENRSAVVLPAVEDMIADRLAQYAVASPSDDSRLRQARLLLQLAKSVDMNYLRRRIADEGGDPALLGIGGAV